MKIGLMVSILLMLLGNANGQVKHVYKDNKTFTYHEAIKAWTQLDNLSEDGKLFSYGRTDAGEPLHLFVIDKGRNFDPEEARKAGKVIVLVNNAIHPGEPCGVDASVQLAEDLLLNKKALPGIHMENTVLCFIPVYNIGGAKNRGCCSRANQNGPEEYGFRGNAKNLDLNRDFIKMDSWNAKTFASIFQKWNPDIFVDTHASNGADYQHTMTLIVSQRNKLTKALQEFADEKLVPYLYADMEKRGYQMMPYMHQMGRTPEAKGIKDYLETPRYSTGYAALFNCLGFVTETHMWKSYPERVKSTYEFLASLVDYTEKHPKEILDARKAANVQTMQQKQFAMNWKLDTAKWVDMPFKGYTAKTKKSEVTGLDRMYYDRDDPFEQDIRYYNEYAPVKLINAPSMYIIPQGYTEVITRLQLNKVKMYPLEKDMEIEVDAYYIADYNTRERPYEFHYLHTNTEVAKQTMVIQYYKGDLVIPTTQPGRRFIVETLEPQGADSYFTWNFFDGILQQKEWFSDYIFEEKAAEILKSNPGLQKEVEAMKQDPETAKNHWAILFHIYKNSPYYEPTHMRYPVTRYSGEPLPLKR